MNIENTQATSINTNSVGDIQSLIMQVVSESEQRRLDSRAAEYDIMHSKLEKRKDLAELGIEKAKESASASIGAGFLGAFIGAIAGPIVGGIGKAVGKTVGSAVKNIGQSSVVQSMKTPFTGKGFPAVGNGFFTDLSKLMKSSKNVPLESKSLGENKSMTRNMFGKLQGFGKAIGTTVSNSASAIASTISAAAGFQMGSQIGLNISNANYEQQQMEAEVDIELDAFVLEKTKSRTEDELRLIDSSRSFVSRVNDSYNESMRSIVRA